ncbi:MAG: hypothetical protein ACO27L_05270, partial [Schleiferiaceae bacterium]
MLHRFIFTIAASLVLLTSCDNTLDVTADFERVPIVYGIINPKSDTQYVRVGRSYLGADGPVGGLNHPDSLYYPNLVVELKAFGPAGALIFTETYTETTDLPAESLREYFEQA